MDTKTKEQHLRKIKENLKAVREVLDVKVSIDDIGGVQSKLINLVEISGLASYTEAIAKSVYDSELAEILELLNQDQGLSKVGSNNLSIIAKGKVSRYQSAVSYSERLGRNISHSIDALRTIISLQKEEMSQNRFNEQV